MDRSQIPDLQLFPGGGVVGKGLDDLARGLASIEALLMLVAAPRLISLGFDIATPESIEPPYEHALFEALVEQDPRGAHSTYNALVDRIISFAESYGRLGRAS